MKLIIWLLAIISLAYSLPSLQRNTCRTNNECDAQNECCHKSIISFFPIYEVSELGTCKKYLLEDADCYLANLGGCGCRPDLICKDIGFIFNFNFTIPTSTYSIRQKGPLPTMRCKKN